MASVIELSVVVPVYGCSGALRVLHERLVASVSQVTPSFELIFVDDRSPDGSWTTLTELAGADPRVRAFRLSRNFGQHAAITAGLAQSRGRWVVVMDCDLQEPPEAIPLLYASAQEGYDLVHSRRTRNHHSLTRRIASRAYFRLRNVILGTATDTDHGTLSLLSRKVVDAFLSVRDQHREYLGLLDWLGFEHTTIEIEQSERYEGRSSYTVRRLMRVALDGLLFQTTVLLRWIVLLGFFVAFGGALLACYLLYFYFFDDPLPGYTSIAVLLLLIGGLIIIMMGVMGLYIGKVFEQAKGRPLFIIDQHAGAASGLHVAPGVGTGVEDQVQHADLVEERTE